MNPNLYKEQKIKFSIIIAFVGKIDNMEVTPLVGYVHQTFQMTKRADGALSVSQRKFKGGILGINSSGKLSCLVIHKSNSGAGPCRNCFSTVIFNQSKFRIQCVKAFTK